MYWYACYWPALHSSNIHITAWAAAWDASSAACWEVAVAHCCVDPLFVKQEDSKALVMLRTSGVPAAQVDKFLRHVCSLLLSLDRVES